MTENEARDWAAALVSRETFERLDKFAALVVRENATQNLVARSTGDCLFSRHIVDSLQLLKLVESHGAWIDVGTGAGFPGLVVGIARCSEMTLIESRRHRADFLRRTAETLELSNVSVINAAAEDVSGSADIISARAVAPLPKLLATMQHLTGEHTTWVLPKGRLAASELEEAKRTWQGTFTMVPSITDPEASIIVAHGVRRRKGVRS